MFQKFNASVACIKCRQYAKLTDEQKEKLAGGPGLEDFIQNEVQENYTGHESIKRVKGERYAHVYVDVNTKFEP